VIRLRRVHPKSKRDHPADVLTLLAGDGKTTVVRARSAVAPAESTLVHKDLLALSLQLRGDGHWSHCHVCRGVGRVIMCSSCANCMHLLCGAPPLSNVPADAWECGECLGQPSTVECANQWREAVLRVIGEVTQLDTQSLFRIPVARMFINDKYAATVQHPMDLHTMHLKAARGLYTNVTDVGTDIDLIVNNCTRFNGSVAALVESAARFGTAAHRCVKALAKRVRDGSLVPVSDFSLTVTASEEKEVPEPVLWPSPEHMVFEGAIRISAASPLQHGTLRYTLDGTDPHAASPIWRQDGMVASAGEVDIGIACFAMPTYSSGDFSGDADEFVGGRVARVTFKFANSGQAQPAAPAPPAARSVVVTSPKPEGAAAQKKRNDKRARPAVGAVDASDLRLRLPPVSVAVLEAFLSHITSIGALSALEKAAYVSIVRALSHGGGTKALPSDIDPFDADRVVRDVLLFAAINSDQLPL
jgi:hypothetical protein